MTSDPKPSSSESIVPAGHGSLDRVDMRQESTTELVPEQVTKMAESLEEGKTIYGGMRYGKRWAMRMARAKTHQKALPHIDEAHLPPDGAGGSEKQWLVSRFRVVVGHTRLPIQNHASGLGTSLPHRIQRREG